MAAEVEVGPAPRFFPADSPTTESRSQKVIGGPISTCERDSVQLLSMDAGPAVRRFPLARPLRAHTQRARIPQTRSIVLLLLIAGICRGNERCDDPREGDPSRPRILLPLNGSFLEAGQGWLFVDAQDEQGPISCSINGREFAELASSRPIIGIISF